MVAARRLASPGERVATVPTFFFHTSPSRTLDNTAGPYTPSDARTLDNVPSLARSGFHAPSFYNSSCAGPPGGLHTHLRFPSSLGRDLVYLSCFRTVVMR